MWSPWQHRQMIDRAGRRARVIWRMKGNEGVCSSKDKHSDQQINASTDQRFNASTHQCFHASTHQRFHASTLQCINTSTLQRINTSTLQRINTSTHPPLAAEEGRAHRQPHQVSPGVGGDLLPGIPGRSGEGPAPGE